MASRVHPVYPTSTSQGNVPTDLLQELEYFPRSTSEEYFFSSRTITLNLGSKYPSCPIPAYGREGIIEGTVEVKKSTNLKDLVVSFCGVASLSSQEKGQPSTRRQRHIVLDDAVVLWSSSSTTPPSPRYSFSITLPSTTRQNTSPLPPSTHLIFESYCVRITYRIQVRVTYRGFRLRRKDSLETEFLYLPKSKPLEQLSDPSLYAPSPPTPEDIEVSATLPPRLSRSPPSYGRVIREGGDSVIGLAGAQTPARTVPAPAELPALASYPSSAPILFQAVLPYTSPDGEGQAVVAKVVRITSFILDGAVYRFDDVVGTGEGLVTREYTDLPGWLVSGELQVDRPEGEASWTLANIIDTQYSIRLNIPGNVLSFEVPIHLASNGAHDLDDDIASWNLPALAFVHQVGKLQRPKMPSWLKVISSFWMSQRS